SRYKISLIAPDEAYKQAEFFNYQQIAKVYEEYELYLKENNLVDFDDLLALTYKILDSNEELAQQISQKYQYIMVDEYQDTNELQLMLLKKLCHTHKNLCVVGDDDQSIYGWRGAHIRNIIEFDQDFTDAKVIKLQKNYRSTNQILKVANTLINHNRGRIGKELESTKGDGKEVIVLNSFDENEEARKISKYIQNLVDEGVKHKDIAILYRVNVLSRSLEEGLNRAGINYKLVGGLRFYERAEIKDLVSYLRIMVNVHDDFSLKRIINKPKRGIGKASLEKIELAAHSKGQSIFEYLDTVSVEELESLVKKKNTKTLKNFVEDVKFVAQSAKDSMYNFIDVLEETFKLKEIYKNTPDEVEKTLNIDEFYALFRDFVKNNPEAELIEFLNDISLQSDQDEIEGESIFMMSIHAAKGLEFEHVFVVGLEEGFLPITGEGSDLEEERRLGYVAFTRAKESLTLSHANSRFYKGRRSDLEKSRFINEAGLCEGSLKVEKTAGFKKGDLVRHKIFGAGRVIGVGKSGKEYKLSINFGGTKRDILSSFVEKL
ncbi:MAG: UvrD-helicase domain-containing protein, partial [Epsilonproteobacteria bacterium]|nr:UvrD-helicase domain-containing protein [Campylobacterota bacterium]